MTRPVRILYTIPNFITAGSGQVLANIVARLDRRVFSPTVCVERRGGRVEDDLRRGGVPVLEAPFTLPARPRRTLPWRAWRAARMFRPHRFQLWHSFHYLDDYTEALIARLAGAKWLYTKKNMSWGSNGWLLRSLQAARVVALNQRMVETFFAGPLLKGKVRRIPCGVDVDLFRPDVPPRGDLRRKLDIPPDALLVGCVAHLTPVKGHPHLLRAVSGVPQVHLLLAGQPQDRDYVAELEALTRELGIARRVHFLGCFPDVAGLLAEIDLFVLSSRSEAYPVALLEAMAAGRAVIATATPGSAEIVHHERDGLLVPVGDATALESAIRRLAASPERRAALGLAARAEAIAMLSVDREVAALQVLYGEVLGLE